jgi:hypothetical protein
MGMPVKTEAEHRQDRCPHLLKTIDADTQQALREFGERDYKYQCVKCGRFLKNLNGVLLGNTGIRPNLGPE